MHLFPRFVRALFSALSLASLLRAEQSTVLNDTFGSGSTINNVATPPATRPSLHATDYQQISAKAFRPTLVAEGQLRFGLPATSSAVHAIEALFTKYPITLVNSGDTVQLTVVFTPAAAMLDFGSSGLFVGLYNANQIQPKPGGLANSSAGSIGNAQNWTGYVSRIMSSGTSQTIHTRPVQGDTATNNQDVVYSYAGQTTIGTGTLSALAPLAAGTTYTVVFTVAKTGASTLDITSELFEGTNTALTPLVAKTVAGTSIPTDTFDALAFGWRATASSTAAAHVQDVDVRNIKVTTTAATTIVPVISVDPFSQTKSVGESVSLAVVASGGGAELGYQWYKGADPISGATGPTHEIASVTLGDAGDYKVVVTDAAGSATSAVATLTVTTGAVAPSLLTHPDDASVLVGGSHTFTAQASGTAPLTYQWRFSSDAGANYADIPGATAATYALSNAQLSDAGLYLLVVTNSLGSATSDPAALTVNQVPTINTPPAGVTLNQGDPLTLSVDAVGTPAPTYVWKRNGTVIPGANASTYSVLSVTGADAGNYTVTLSNSVGAATSAIASVAVVVPGFASTGTTPASAAGSILPDTRLSITFNQPVFAGVSGFIRIHDAVTDAVVDTVDLVAATTLKNTLRAASTLSTRDLPVQNKTIGTLTNFNYYAITLSGDTATIHPRNGVLAYDKSYYVTVDPGVFVNSTGGSFPGISGASAWTFSIKASGPAPGAPLLTVAADGSGDFHTVQGALDSLPAGNTAPTTLFLRDGTYFETVYFTNKHNITFLGESRARTIIEYPNNNNLNNVSGVYHRMTFYGDNVSGIVIANLTVLNSTPQNGSQAEAIIMRGNATTGRNLITQVDCYSYQDTVQFTGQVYVSDSRIEGDVDFMWGGGPAFFKNCDIKMLRASGGYLSQIRNSAANHGFVYVDCRLTSIPGSTGNFLARIDPSAFPDSEVVWINCSMGGFISPAGWKFDNVSTGPNVHFWEHNSTDSATGLPLDVSGRLAASRQLTQPADATNIANYSDASYVLGGWNPALAPIITAQPQGAILDAGQPLTLQVSAAAVPAATYQWYKGVDPIPGATAATYTVGSASSTDTGVYSVTVTNTSGSVPSATATVTVNSTATGLESWRETHFGSAANTGDAADAADPDEDGLSNLLEYATGRDPNAIDSAAVTAIAKSGDELRLTLTYTRVADPELVYTVQGTDDLSGTPVWSEVSSSTGGANVAGPITVTDTRLISASPRRFLRLHVGYAP